MQIADKHELTASTSHAYRGPAPDRGVSQVFAYHESLRRCILQVGDDTDSLEALVPILGGKPLLAMNFHDMEVRIAPGSHISATPAFCHNDAFSSLLPDQAWDCILLTLLLFSDEGCVPFLQMSVQEPTILRANERRVSKQLQLH
jgi:hypothetical protein